MKVMKMGKLVTILALVAAPLLVSGMPVAAADAAPKPPKVGDVCTKNGDVDGKLFCQIKNGKLKWNEPVLPAGEYKLGFEALTSGAAAFAGVPLAQGVRLAVAQINLTGFLGKGVTIKLIEQDSGGSAANGIAAINAFKAQGVSGVVCCALSSQAGAEAPILKAAGIPGIIDSAVLPGLAQPPYMYRPVILLGTSGGPNSKLIDTVVKKYKTKSAVVAVTADNQGMVSDKDTFVESLGKSGVKTVNTVNTAAADTDLSGAASQITALNPDMVVNSMLGGPGTRLIKALRERGYKGVIVSNYGVGDQNNYTIGGSALAGTIFPVIYFPASPANAMAKKFAADYKTYAKEDSSIYGAQGFTAMMLLASGLKASGDGNPVNVALALSQITRMNTVYGPIAFAGGQGFLAKDVSPSIVTWTATGTQEIWKP